MRWCWWAAAVSPKLRPKDRAALGALKPVVLDGLADLSGAISAAMHIGANCFDSPIYKQMAKDESEAHAKRSPVEGATARRHLELWPSRS